VETARTHDATTGGRFAAVRKAAAAWTGQLVDLTGRNSLLYYRDLKVGTLPLDSSPRQLIYAVLAGRQALGIRTYISEPGRGRRRNWRGKSAERRATYANRRRIRGERGKGLLRSRGELLERGFAHCYDTGGMRRVHLRGRQNISKRLLVHVAAFNLSLILRRSLGVGKPRGLQGTREGRLFLLFTSLLTATVTLLAPMCTALEHLLARRDNHPIPLQPLAPAQFA